MPSRSRICIALAGVACALFAAPAARADVIDGDWCQSGKRLSIKGPDIVTPAGTRLQGSYSRHFFTYVVPAADAGAGQIVAMTLVNENTVHLRTGADAAAAAQAPVEVWLRCAPAVSLTEPSAEPASRDARYVLELTIDG